MADVLTREIGDGPCFLYIKFSWIGVSFVPLSRDKINFYLHIIALFREKNPTFLCSCLLPTLHTASFVKILTDVKKSFSTTAMH